MESARQINKKLDEILIIQSQIKELNELAPDAQFDNKETGEKVTKEIVLNKGQEQLAQLEKELNEITNNGKNCREVFTNPYYINDFAQDKLIAEEIKLNKMEACLAKQNNPENN